MLGAVWGLSRPGRAPWVLLACLSGGLVARAAEGRSPHTKDQDLGLAGWEVAAAQGLAHPPTTSPQTQRARPLRGQQRADCAHIFLTNCV